MSDRDDEKRFYPCDFCLNYFLGENYKIAKRTSRNILNWLTLCIKALDCELARLGSWEGMVCFTKHPACTSLQETFGRFVHPETRRRKPLHLSFFPPSFFLSTFLCLSISFFFLEGWTCVVSRRSENLIAEGSDNFNSSILTDLTATMTKKQKSFR